MVDLVNTTSGITRLNNHNYQSWRSCIKSYLEGQDLWEVINGDDTESPTNFYKLRKWKVKAGKVMYVLKSTIEDELLRQINDDDTPKMAWDTFASLFSNTNDAQLKCGIGDTGIRPVEMDRASMLRPKLYKAAKEGDVHCLSEIDGRNMTEEEAMTNQHGNFLKRTQYGNNNILHIAARAGRDNFVAEVLCRFPFLSDQMNSQGDTPLLVAARSGHLEVVKELTKSATEKGTKLGVVEDRVDHTLEPGHKPAGMATVLENQTNSSSSHHRREVGEGIVDRQLEQSTCVPDSIVINIEDVMNLEDMAPDMEEGPVHLQLDGLIPSNWQVTNLEQGITVMVTTALHEALRNGHEDVARYLLELKPEMAEFDNLAEESPLFLAAESGCELFMLGVLQSRRRYSTKGPDGQNALHAARNCDDDENKIISQLITQNPDLMRQLDSRGKAAIHYAVEAEKLDLVDRMLEADASIALFPDADGYTPLLRAASKGYLKIFRDILKKCPESIEACNYQGRNALHLFKIRNNKYPGRNALHIFRLLGTRSDWEELFKIPEMRELLNIGDNEGNTPLHLAIEEHHSDKAIFLTARRYIDLGAVNRKGLTALDLCKLKWNQGLIHWLLSCQRAPHGRCSNDQEVPVDGLDLKPFLNTMTLVATLIATVTFTAAFTMPGGFDTSSDNLGVAILVKKASLKVFILADSIAMCCSMAVMFLLMWAMIADKDMETELAEVSSALLPYALFATLVAFVSAIFAVIAPKALWVAILVLIFCFYVICSSSFGNVLVTRFYFLLMKVPEVIHHILPGIRKKGRKRH